MTTILSSFFEKAINCPFPMDAKMFGWPFLPILSQWWNNYKVVEKAMSMTAADKFNFKSGLDRDRP